jgi:hypothetical protein
MSGVKNSHVEVATGETHLCLLLLAWETGKLDMLSFLGCFADRRLATNSLW